MGCCFPRGCREIAVLKICLQSVFVPLEGSALITVPLLQLSIQKHLWNPIIFHAYNMSCPSQLALDDQALNAGEVTLFQTLEVRHSVLPFNVADPPQGTLMKLF